MWSIIWHLVVSVAGTTQILLICLLNGSFFRNIDTIQICSHLLVLTVVTCWTKAAGFDTSSMSFPSKISSSVWAWDTKQATSGLIRTLRMYFSCKKIRISTRAILLHHDVGGDVRIHSPHLVTAPSVTPWIIFCVWLQRVRPVASSFLFPHHLSTWSLFFFPRRLSSTLMWSKSLLSAPGALLRGRASF